MPYKNYSDALKNAERRRLEEHDRILEIQRRCYHNNLESERLRMRKKYQFKKECLRLRNILLL